MILTSCNYMLADIVPELRRAGILWHNPYRLQHNGWNPLHGARPLAAFLAPQRATFGDKAHAWTYDELDRWTAPLSAKASLKHGAKATIHTEGRLGDQEVPIARLLEWFDEAALARAMDGDIDWWWENLTAANQKRQNLRMMVSMTHKEPATLSLTPRVIVGTIHSVKGGEADHVWLFPDLSQKGQDEMDNGDADSIIRQYYVGVTRARDSLALCGAAGRRKVDFW
jgi:superfamily I DNA/RNA helicase